MRQFDYARAAARHDATAAAASGAVIIAGGTNLLDLMKLEVMTPTASSTSTGSSLAASSAPTMAACGSARWFATAISLPIR